ncbi:MAG TPA: hypothetical protein VNG51_12815 [Ktedonobacteraceae bacterium]|nr:hypothetical protein [Ktedonobacteraceae bacterium]
MRSGWPAYWAARATMMVAVQVNATCETMVLLYDHASRMQMNELP